MTSEEEAGEYQDVYFEAIRFLHSYVRFPTGYELVRISPQGVGSRNLYGTAARLVSASTGSVLFFSFYGVQHGATFVSSPRNSVVLPSILRTPYITISKLHWPENGSCLTNGPYRMTYPAEAISFLQC